MGLRELLPVLQPSPHSCMFLLHVVRINANGTKHPFFDDRERRVALRELLDEACIIEV
jgi:hypothetical protein